MGNLGNLVGLHLNDNKLEGRFFSHFLYGRSRTTNLVLTVFCLFPRRCPNSKDIPPETAAKLHNLCLRSVNSAVKKQKILQLPWLEDCVARTSHETRKYLIGGGFGSGDSSGGSSGSKAMMVVVVVVVVLVDIGSGGDSSGENQLRLRLAGSLVAVGSSGMSRFCSDRSVE